MLKLKLISRATKLHILREAPDKKRNRKIKKFIK